MKLIGIVALSALMFSVTAAHAGDCSLTITRSACEGKDTEVYKPYAGKNPTTETRPKAATAEECLKEGEKSAKIVRKGLITKKSVKVEFGGKEVGVKEDTSTTCEK